jgi:hypothetical protein
MKISGSRGEKDSVKLKRTEKSYALLSPDFDLSISSLIPLYLLV